MKRLTATDLARGLSEVLNRVEYRDEEFEVERNGRVVARIVAAEPSESSLRDLIELLETLPRDPGFADDLQAVQDAQPRVPGESPWES